MTLTSHASGTIVPCLFPEVLYRAKTEYYGFP